MVGRRRGEGLHGRRYGVSHHLRHRERGLRRPRLGHPADALLLQRVQPGQKQFHLDVSLALARPDRLARAGTDHDPADFLEERPGRNRGRLVVRHVLVRADSQRPAARDAGPPGPHGRRLARLTRSKEQPTMHVIALPPLPLTMSLTAATPPGRAPTEGWSPSMVAENPCTNGSFETLGPNGFPADWGPVGATVEVSSDAHSGERSLRFSRTADNKTVETGLNRGPLIERL